MEKDLSKKGKKKKWKKVQRQGLMLMLTAGLITSTIPLSFAGDGSENSSSIFETERSVTGDLGHGEITESDEVSLSVNWLTGKFEAIVMYKNDKGKEFALKTGSLVDNDPMLEAMNTVVVKVNEKGFLKLLNNPDIEYVEKNVIMEGAESAKQDYINLRTYGKMMEFGEELAPWGHEPTGISGADSNGYTGKGVKVAVLDTGVSQHREFNVHGGTSIVTYTKQYTDDDGHGTHVAGIIGAQKDGVGMVGVAPGVQLYSVKILDNLGRGTANDAIKGILWAIENDMDIINASVGFAYESPIFHEAIKRATDNNIPVVAASGNYGVAGSTADTMRFPAKYAEAIAVGAIDGTEKRASYSSTGNDLDFVAPGTQIVSTSNKGGYVSMSGTSMSTPYVTGMLAILMEAFPGKSVAEYESILKEHVIDLGAKGFDVEYGHGLASFGSLFPAPKNELTAGLSPELYNKAVAAVETYERNTVAIYGNLAKTAVEALIESPEKEALADRLGYLGNYIDGYTLKADMVLSDSLKKSTETAVARAEKTPTLKLYIENAVKAVNGLPNGPEKDAFVLRMQALGQFLDLVIEEEEDESQDPVSVTIDPKVLQEVERNVGYAERYKLRLYNDRAIKSVGDLPASSEKDAFLIRMHKLGLMLDVQLSSEAVKKKEEPIVEEVREEEQAPVVAPVQIDAKALSQAEQYVTFAERYTTKFYQDKAIELVNALPASLQKNGFLTRMHKLGLMLNVSPTQLGTPIVEETPVAPEAPSTPIVEEKTDPVVVAPVQIDAKALSQAEQYVGFSERYTTKFYRDKAIELVNALPASLQKNELLVRMHKLGLMLDVSLAQLGSPVTDKTPVTPPTPIVEETLVEEAPVNTEAPALAPTTINASDLKKADQYVGYAVKYNTNFYQTKAIEYVEALPASPERDKFIITLKGLGLMVNDTLFIEDYIKYIEKNNSSFYQSKVVEYMKMLPASIERDKLLKRLHAIDLMKDTPLFKK